jgi:hypothetical protein
MLAQLSEQSPPENRRALLCLSDFGFGLLIHGLAELRAVFVAAVPACSTILLSRAATAASPAGSKVSPASNFSS